MRSRAGGWSGLSTSERLPFLEGMRGILAIYVVLGHIASMADPSGLAGQVSKSPIWMQQLLAPFAYGHLAVAGFIVLSGFCLQLSLYSSGVDTVKHGRRFFERRAKRILPAYYVALLFSLWVCFAVTMKLPGDPFSLYLPVTVDNTVAHFLLVQNWRTDWMYKINGVMWSIAIEAQLYLLFPILATILARWGRVSTLVSALAVSAVCTMALPNGPKLYAWYLGLFAMGMIGACFAFRPGGRRAPSAGPGFAAALAAIVYLWVALVNRWELPVRDLGMGVLVSALSYAFTVEPHWQMARWLGSRPLYWLGAMSYSLYLFHHPLQQIFYFVRPYWANDPEGKLWFILACLPLIVGISRFVYRYVEKPFARGHSDTAQDEIDSFFPLSLPLRPTLAPSPNPP